MEKQRFIVLISIFLVLITVIRVDAYITTGLTHHWDMNEASGSIIYDKVGTSNMQVNGTPTWENSSIDGSLWMKTGDYAYTQDNVTTAYPNPGTYSCWVFIKSQANESGTEFPIFSLGTPTGFGIYQLKLSLMTDADWMRWYPYDYYVPTSYGSPVGSWSMLTVAMSSTHTYIYLNATQFGGTDDPPDPLRTGLSPFFIGSATPWNTFFDSNVSYDQCDVWNNTFNSGDVATMWNGGQRLTYTPPFSNISVMAYANQSIYLVPSEEANVYAIFDLANITITSVEGCFENPFDVNDKTCNSFFINNSPTNWSYLFGTSPTTYTANLTNLLVTDTRSVVHNLSVYAQVNFTNPPSNSAPSEPILTYPDEGAIINSNSLLPVILTWNASIDPDNDTTYYEVYIGENNATTLVANTSNLQYNTTLLNQTTYHWFVRASDGQNYSQSQTRFFTIDTIPPVLTLLSPLSTVTTTGYSLVIATDKMATCKYATSYDVYANLPSTFDSTGGTLHTQLLGATNSVITFTVACNTTHGVIGSENFTVTIDIPQAIVHHPGGGTIVIKPANTTQTGTSLWDRQISPFLSNLNQVTGQAVTRNTGITSQSTLVWLIPSLILLIVIIVGFLLYETYKLIFQ